MSTRILLALFVLLSLILLARILFYVSNVKPYKQGQVLTFETKVPSQPRINVDGQRITFNLPNSQRATATLALSPVLSYGDIVRVKATLSYVKLKSGDEILVLDNPMFSLVKAESRSNLLLIVRERIISFFTSNLGSREASLVLGIVFGIKDEIPKQFSEDLRRVGLTHVIVASGMNITMVGGFLAGLFSYFMRRQTALVLSILGICFYALLTGAEPSIIRASVMGILVFAAQIIGRQSTAYLGLFLAGFVMLFVNPSLVFDIGFQLSFLATFGLIFFRPIFLISRKLKRMVEKSIIGEDLLTTITAQLFTLPILLVNFGSYSILSVLVNAIVLWTVPFIMIIGGFAGLIGLIFEPMGQLISFAALPFLFYFEKVVDVFSSFKLQVSITSLPLSLIAGYYLLLIALAIGVKQRK